MNNKDKIIISFCGGTGSWERFYREAGYTVVLITLPDYDVRKSVVETGTFFIPHTSGDLKKRIFIPTSKIYGILTAPPCTMFSYARTNAKKQRDLKEGMECVRACLNIVWSVMEVKQDTNKKPYRFNFGRWKIRITAS
jgi:hypothetical protein